MKTSQTSSAWPSTGRPNLLKRSSTISSHAARFKEVKASSAPGLRARARAALHLSRLVFVRRQAGALRRRKPPREARGARLSTVRDLLQKVSERLDRVAIETRDCVECVTRYDGSRTLFLRPDPPYYQKFAIAWARTRTWRRKSMRASRQAFAHCRGRFLVTYNDHPRIRAMYSRIPGVMISVRAAEVFPWAEGSTSPKASS